MTLENLTERAPGMSKNAWKRYLKEKRWEETRDQRREQRKEKLRLKKQERKQQQADLKEADNVDSTAIQHRNRPGRRILAPEDFAPYTLVIDCAFDELMIPKEVVSLSAQIVRAYSENRKIKHPLHLAVTSFNGRLKERFETNMKGAHALWKDIKFSSDPYEIPEDKSSVVYLSSDSPHTINELEPNKTYIIGGIVDKGRYKNLCHDKAVKQGIATAKLPISEYIEVSGRKVLTTNHVVEILLKWSELKDWKEAFMAVIPPRKIRTEQESAAKVPTSETEPENETENDATE
ncbi:hypothetical protein CANCADRAFT_27699 [Tortispora caseinolytica NRRL Y-17796]|uniref:tRNA (guanine(9)-N1)-methyltransferase n=1 Tax=Tortispora caseinolytica NRRL Y-17796 TaxID=767744 RepID=A0A1E4TCD6_9ASCO|nr:hypothetical protein CANCADRAFT_27699 [Tortispora caseinolytica NRRL Y-17796]